MKIVGKCQHVPQIFCSWTGWPTTSLMAFSMEWHFWVCPEIFTYILCSLMHCEKEASLVKVRQETGEHNDVIQTCSGLTLFCYSTESGYKHKSWWRLIPSVCAASDRNWASLTLSSLDSLNEWAVRGCQKSVLLCRECRIFSWVALYPQPNLSCCLWRSLVIHFLWCVWDVETTGSNREKGRGRKDDMETAQCHSNCSA